MFVVAVAVVVAAVVAATLRDAESDRGRLGEVDTNRVLLSVLPPVSSNQVADVRFVPVGILFQQKDCAEREHEQSGTKRMLEWNVRLGYVAVVGRRTPWSRMRQQQERCYPPRPWSDRDPLETETETKPN